MSQTKSKKNMTFTGTNTIAMILITPITTILMKRSHKGVQKELYREIMMKIRKCVKSMRKTKNNFTRSI